MKRFFEVAGVPLIAAVLGLGGGLAGAYLGAHATIVTQREQLQASRSAEARTKRATVYAQFLAASNRYAVETTQALSILRKCAHAGPRRPFLCSSLGKQAGPAQNARYEFQGALTDVYVYGSTTGVRAALNVADTLPPSVGHLNGHISLVPISEVVFTRTYQAFLSVMCREVSAEPRSTC